MLTHDSPTLHRLERVRRYLSNLRPGTGGVSGVNFPRYQRSVKIVDIFNKTNSYGRQYYTASRSCLYIRILLCAAKAWALLHRIQIMVPHDQRFRKLPAQFA